MAEIAESESDYQPDVDHHSFNPDNVNTAESTTFNPDHMMEVDKVTEAGSSVDGADHMSWSGDSLDHSLRLEEVPITAGGDHSNLQCTSPAEKRQRMDNSSKESPKTSARSSPRPNTGDNLSVSSGKESSTDESRKSPDHKAQDVQRKEKEKEREEKIRLQREKMAEERAKKLEEMKEQQRLAQEKRDRQLELRRMKIEELRRRDEERRVAVEERRKRLETQDKARKEAIIQKSNERQTRYEQWKAQMNSRKGGISYVIGFGSRAPRSVCQPLERRRSSSHSTIYRRSPQGSDADSYIPHRRAFSACSVRRHCCIDINKLTGQGMSTNQQHVKLKFKEFCEICHSVNVSPEKSDSSPQHLNVKFAHRKLKLQGFKKLRGQSSKQEQRSLALYGSPVKEKPSLSKVNKVSKPPRARRALFSKLHLLATMKSIKEET